MISIGALNLHIEEAGPTDGPLVILLHGFPETSRAWRKVMQPLADKGLRVVAPDLRGYGKSDVPAGRDAYALDTLAADIVGLADALGAPTFALVGHDWGGIVAWAVAARHPERLSRLIILNAPHADTVKAEMRAHPAQILRSLYVGFFRFRAFRRHCSGRSGSALCAVRSPAPPAPWRSMPAISTPMWRAGRVPAGSPRCSTTTVRSGCRVRRSGASGFRR